MSFYEANVKLEWWKEFKRVFEYEWQIHISDIKDTVLKDVFYKIEDWDMDQVENFNFSTINEETFKNIKNTEKCVEMILKNNNWIIGKNTLWRKSYN